jgi:oligosaccharide repeat unit polymerase
MNNFDFLSLIIDSPYTYTICILLALTTFYFIYKRIVISVLDPFFLTQLFSAIGFATVLFLLLQNVISTKIFLQYILSQSAFIIGFFTFKKVFKSENYNFSINQNQTQFFLFFFFTLIFFIQIYIYSTKGIPLLMKSRLELYRGGSGVGIFSRILDVAYPAFYFSMSSLWFSYRRKTIYKVLFAITLFFLVLSGSKSSFLMPVYGFFIFTVFNGNTDQLLQLFKKNRKWILSGVFLMVLLIIYIQALDSDSDSGALFRLGLRIIFAGDIYWYAYPFETYKIVDASHPFQSIFLDFVGLFRITDWSKIESTVGLELYQYFHPTDLLMGPNSRHNVFGMVYFGFWGSIVFSLILGLITSVFRFLFLKLSKKNIVTGIFYSCLYLNAVTFEIDPMLGFTHLNNIVFILPFLILLGLCLFELIFKFTLVND